MKVPIKDLFRVVKTAFKKWKEKDPFRESAVIAYYAIFSLPGLLVVIVTVAGYFFGQEAVNGKITSQITATMGAETALQIQDLIAKASASKKSLFATVVGILTIILGGTGVFVQFQKSLNYIWDVKPDETKSGILSILKARLFSFGIIISFAFILVVSLVVSATLSALGTWLTYYFSESFLLLIQVINFIFSFCILAVLFALMFKYFPDAKIKWRHVWIGAIVTAILFETGKFALELYFGTAKPSSGYGAAGSIILILLWVSYSTMIVFYGAEFTRAYAEMRDGKIPPEQYAVKKITPPL